MSYVSTKRLLDIVGSGFGLLVLFPLGVLIGVLIKLCDRGPVFYTQTRIGQFEKPFHIWKFRSMVVNADKLGLPLTSEEDTRITRVGRFLRKSKLDELPQLWNVLCGEMSLVGPRPEVPRYVEFYTPAQREILKCKPGITDLASLRFRNEEALLRGATDAESFYLRYCLPKKIELNRQYGERATLWQDLWIISQTLCPYWLIVLVLYWATLNCSFWISYELRSDFHASRRDYQEFLRWAPRIVLPQLLFLVWVGQMRGLLSYFSLPEMRRTLLALSLGLLAQLGLWYAWPGDSAPTLNVFIIDFVLSFFSLCAVHMVLRLWRERKSGRPVGGPTRQVAIIGTGDLATNLILDFARATQPGRRVVALFDDDPNTWHKRPYGVPVAGMPECLLNQEWREQIDEVIVTLPEGSARLQEIREMMKGLPMKVTIASGWPVVTSLESRG